ncbi:MAG TPA: hypothetical protein VG986_19630 [Pseudolabrys sp.]|nr:hypothetical protein [Pseudolabrys sp.]
MDLGHVTVSVTRRPVVAGAVKAIKLIALPIVLFVVLLSAGCAPTRTGATLDDLNRKIGGPAGGQARIVVIRDKGIGTLFDSGWQVYLDGAAMADLKTGTFVYQDRPAGPHKLSFSRVGDFSRASTRDFVAASGRTYVFRLDLNEKGRMVQGSGVVAGLAGMLVTSAISDASDQRGFFDFTLLEGEAARQALADIHAAE